MNHPYKTRDGGATVTIFVPYDCKNHCPFCINKGEKGGRALEAKAGRGLVVALLLFVGIPLPGTGAWTGTLAGSILDMKFKDVLIACMSGVLLAGIIMGLASAGLLGAVSTLFAVK